jgi:hypothetical protein
MLKLGLGLRYLKCKITKCVYVRPGVKIRLGLMLKVIKVVCVSFSFLPAYPMRPKHVVMGNVWCICATNCVDQWYSTGGKRTPKGTLSHLRVYVKYLCSFINFYMTGDNIFVI